MTPNSSIAGGACATNMGKQRHLFPRTARLLAVAAIALLSLQDSAAFAAERLVYSVHSNAVVAGRLPGKLVWKQTTTIYSWDAATRKATQIFSDRDQPVMLLIRSGSGESQTLVIVPFRHRLLALGARRVPGVSEGPSTDPGSIYELTLDGSNQAREIAVVQSSQPLERLAVSSDGNRIAYIGYQESKTGGQRPFLVVIDNNGQSLAKTPLDGFLKDGYVSFLKWSDHNQKLAWRVGVIDDGEDSEDGPAGSYVTRWDGTQPQRAGTEFPEDDSERITSPLGNLTAVHTEVGGRPGDVESEEISVLENHVKTRIVSVPRYPSGFPSSGVGAQNQFLSLLGWME